METKKPFTILGLSVWRIMAYFIIYSVIGYIIETLFGLLTMGILESRQSFLYGPFCGIYGIGATLMIIGMQKLPKTYNWLFLGGFILGSVTEYFISWTSEKFAGITWWDYSYMPLNINGRVCLLYSIFWGLLAIYLMGYFNLKVDRCMYWIKTKISTKVLKGFVPNKEETVQLYEQIYGNPKLAEFIYKYWGDEKMIKTFPNLKIENREGQTIYINKLLPDIKPYYIKFDKTER